MKNIDFSHSRKQIEEMQKQFMEQENHIFESLYITKPM